MTSIETSRNVFPALSLKECSYIRKKLKRKERVRLLNFLAQSDSIDDADEPIRIKILRSKLPNAYRRQLFALIADDGSEKHLALVRAALRLPFGKLTVPLGLDDPVCQFLRCAEVAMDERITGHANAKREVLAILSQWRAGGTMPYAISLEGPPGIGKTTFVKHALAAAMGRPLGVVCLGGASDGSFILGHGFTYEGARYGRLAEVLMESKTMDPVLFFDELDKVSETSRGDEIVNMLIHLTDPMQPIMRDRYFQGLDLDFSKCIKVFAYNNPKRVSPVLRDRLKRIVLDAPDKSTKVAIARRHIVPRVRDVTRCDMPIDDECIEALVEAHADDAGMRGVERATHEVLAAAVMCTQYGSMRVVGMDDAPMGERVTADFARGVLGDRTVQDTRTGPPALMYM